MTSDIYAAWPGEIRADLEANRFNPRVGTKLVSETDRVRVWHLSLQPGERCAFHRHVLTYFWTCHTDGEATSYFEDGSINRTSYSAGDTKHMSYARGEHFVHNLVNTGATPLLFTTVEFKDGDNEPLRLD